MIKFSFSRPKTVSIIVFLLMLSVLGLFSRQSQLITKNNQDCSTVILQHIDSTQSYSVNLINLKECDCKLPGLSMNGYLIAILGAGTAFIYRGVVEDFGTIFNYYYLDIDGDSIKEAIALAETEDNISGAIYRITLDSSKWPEFQILSVPQIGHDIVFDVKAFTQSPDGSLLWTKSINSDTNYIIYYDKKNDSLAVRTKMDMK